MKKGTKGRDSIGRRSGPPNFYCVSTPLVCIRLIRCSCVFCWCS